MFVLQTIIVYLCLLVCMLGLSKYAQVTHKWAPIIIAILLYAIVFGVRYGVGADYLAYLNYYKFPEQINKENIEAGFVFLIKSLSSIGLHYSFYFGIIAFVQLYCIYKSIQKYDYAFVSLTFVFMLEGYWLTFSNGLRQVLAFSILVCAIPYLVKQKWIPFAILGLLATCFHKSAIIPLLVYPLFCIRKLYFNSIVLQLIVLAISILLMNVNIVSFILDKVEGIIYTLGYGVYVENDYNFSTDVGLGIGFYVTLFSNIILILNSNGMKQMFKETWIPYAYNLFYIGVILKYIFISSQFFSRINYYFLYFELFIGAFTLVYLWRKKRNFAYALIGLYILTFVACMYRMDTNTAMYFFFWQEDQYRFLFNNRF